MRLKQIDILRGIAALFVTFFHLTGSTGLSKTLASYGSFGWIGVQFFFVISGFILPYSMQRFGYQINNFGTFMLKRMLRIYPAYLIAVVISITMAILTNREILPGISTFLSLFFLNDIFSISGWSPVFWTLAIEIQFYLLLGLCYPVLIKSNINSIIFIFLVSLLAIWTPSYILINWFPFFGLGILVFNKHFTNLPLKFFWLSVTLLIFIIIFVHGYIHAIAGLFAVLFILYFKAEKEIFINKLMLKLGIISYSLYLVHWELGRAVISITRRIPVIVDYEIVRLSLGLISSIIFAYLLYVIIEKPSLKLNSKVRYKTPPSLNFL